MILEDMMVYLECLMLNEINLDFLQVDYQQGFIYIFIVSHKFKTMPISERIEHVFSIIKYDCPEILTQYPIAIEAFDDSEFSERLKIEKEKRAKRIAPRKK